LREGVKQLQAGLKYVAKHSGLTQRLSAAPSGENELQQQQYFWGAHPTLADFAYLPNICSIDLFLKHAAKIDIFEALDDADKEHLQAFGKWFAHAKQNESFQRATYRVPSLPPAEKSAIIAENAWTTPEQWNYEKYWRAYFSKRFNIQLVA